METLPYVSGSNTSKDAAASARQNAAVTRMRVAEEIRNRGEMGATDEEVQYALQLPGNTKRPRRIELGLSGHVYDSGKRRSTRAGRDAVVWLFEFDVGKQVERQIAMELAERLRQVRIKLRSQINNLDLDACLAMNECLKAIQCP